MDDGFRRLVMSLTVTVRKEPMGRKDASVSVLKPNVIQGTDWTTGETKMDDASTSSKEFAVVFFEDCNTARRKLETMNPYEI